MELVLYRSVHYVCTASVQFIVNILKPSRFHRGQGWAWKGKYFIYYSDQFKQVRYVFLILLALHWRKEEYLFGLTEKKKQKKQNI